MCKLPFHNNTNIFCLHAEDTAIFNTDQNLTSIQCNIQKDFDLLKNLLLINRMYTLLVIMAIFFKDPIWKRIAFSLAHLSL